MITATRGEAVVNASNVADAVAKVLHSGDRLPTPTGRGVFEIGEITDGEIILLLGERRTRTRVPWSVLDHALSDMSGNGWMLIGAIHTSESPQRSLEAILKPALHRSTANYVAVLLERAGLVEIDRARPAWLRVAPTL